MSLASRLGTGSPSGCEPRSSPTMAGTVPSPGAATVCGGGACALEMVTRHMTARKILRLRMVCIRFIVAESIAQNGGLDQAGV